MAAGSLYLLLFGGCFLFILVAGAIAWGLYAIGRRREARAADARAARRAVRLQNRDGAAVLSEHPVADDPDRGEKP